MRCVSVGVIKLLIVLFNYQSAIGRDNESVTGALSGTRGSPRVLLRNPRDPIAVQ